jgi:hypothetical protein
MLTYSLHMAVFFLIVFDGTVWNCNNYSEYIYLFVGYVWFGLFIMYLLVNLNFKVGQSSL